MYSDLPPDGIVAKKVVDVVLKYYQTDDPAITREDRVWTSRF